MHHKGVGDASKTIYVATMGYSPQVIKLTEKKQGPVVGNLYDIVWRGRGAANLRVY